MVVLENRQKIRKRETINLKNMSITHLAGNLFWPEKLAGKIILDRKRRRKPEKLSITGHNSIF